MRKIYLISPTAALLGLLAIAADTVPALAGGAAAGYSLTTGAYLQLPPQLSPWPQVAQVPIFGGPETFAQAPQPTASAQTSEVPEGFTVNASPSQ